MSTTIDLSPIISSLLELAGAVVLCLGTAVLHRIYAKLGIDVEGANAKRLDAAAAKAVTWGLSQVLDLIAAKGWDHPEVRDKATKAAADYLLARFPDALARVGINPNRVTVGNEMKIRGIIDRTFALAAAPVAESPVTPAKALTAEVATKAQPPPARPGYSWPIIDKVPP